MTQLNNMKCTGRDGDGARGGWTISGCFDVIWTARIAKWNRVCFGQVLRPAGVFYLIGSPALSPLRCAALATTAKPIISSFRSLHAEIHVFRRLDVMQRFMKEITSGRKVQNSALFSARQVLCTEHAPHFFLHRPLPLRARVQLLLLLRSSFGCDGKLEGLNACL